MSKDSEFVSDLTELPRTSPEEDDKTSYAFLGFTKFFSFARSSESPDSVRIPIPENTSSDNKGESSNSAANPNPEGRSLPNVLKRISNNLLTGKDGLTSYDNTTLKKYWMPDSFSKECYDCGEKFSTFRRRHHCRICGQIFCKRCCNQRIPGKIMGCVEDLRACVYCCKLVISYMESSDISADMKADLQSIQEDLQTKLRRDYDNQPSTAVTPNESVAKRKPSVGYQEERFVLGQAPSCSVLSDEERCQALQNSASLRALFEEILYPVTGVTLQTFNYRQQDVPNCLSGSDLVDWLIANSKAATRVQALAMGQMLLEAGYIEPTTEFNFVDGESSYRVISSLISPPQLPANRNWGLSTDSESEKMSEDEGGLHQSGSSYLLDMNMEERVVHVARPPPSPAEPQPSTRRKKTSVAQEASVLLDPPSQHNSFDIVLKSGWHRAAILVRPVHGEAEAYHSSAFDTHEAKLLGQLLINAGLKESWAEVVTPIARAIVDQVQPDYRQNDEMDIRLYAKIKKLPGGSLADLKIVPGVVFSKNVAHRAMRTHIENPKILLLQCAVVYQRVEDRILSLEPVIMQEHEYLRHVVARIASLRPDVVLVHKNVSRLAQEYLLDLGITLVLNVKTSVLERVARFTGADMVKRVDAHVGELKLGVCKKFYIDTYRLENDVKKTLMIFEGPLNPKVGCTILLRGGTLTEFSKLKKILSFLILSEYNWRLEKSFLMDEFAKPPAPPTELFLDSPTESPDYKQPICKPNEGKLAYEESFEDDSPCAFDGEKPIKQPAKILEAEIKECSPGEDLKINDPLQADHNDPIWIQATDTVQLSVAELPRGNKFRTALDDTILSISPFLKLGVPYLESEIGRNCHLRSYFPDTIYYSKQLIEAKSEKEVRSAPQINQKDSIVDQLLPMHKMLTTKLTDDVSDANVQTLLALFRANGGRIPLGLKLNAKRIPATTDVQKCRDVLDAFEHQRFSVLFCSYSSHSENAPAFCVDPWVVNMVSYGPHDIPLGVFLETYCFRPSDSCTSQTCRVSMQQHIRRFVHDAGVLCLTLGTLPKKLETDKICLWNWCVICATASPMVPMSADTWSLSFAKYLELRFLGDSYTLRGSATCQHNLHHEHHQYFAKGNLVAAFKFSPIHDRWEISLPPRLISLEPTINTDVVIVDLRNLAIKGHDVFSSIVEHLIGLDTLSEEEMQTMEQQELKDQAAFKSQIEEIQFRLTSPTLENKAFDPHQAIRETAAALWRVEDSIVNLKRHICETVQNWNVRFLDSKKKDDRKRFSDGNVKSQVSPPQSEDGRSRDDDVNSTYDTEDDPIWEKFSDSVDVPDSEDNLSVASQQEDGKALDDSLKGKRNDPKDRAEESHVDSKSDKKSVKTIISQMLASNKDSSPIQCPWSPQEHYMLPPGAIANIVVIETEPSSIVAFGLASQEHQRHLEEKRNSLSLPVTDSSTPSPIHRKKPLSSSSSADKETDPVSSPHHCELNFSDTTTSFNCKVYYAEFFFNLRSLVFPAGEEAFIRSLARCVHWAARGGKSGSIFCKSKDDRFVIKQMSKTEMGLFLEFAPQYTKYVTNCHEDELPTLLGKILGVYTVSCRNSSGVSKSNLLVMENLFYLRDVTFKYDLKGSVRNRLVNPIASRDPDIVYLDENLLKMTCDSPLYILPHSQTVLMRAIERDTEFLAAQRVMDYSLLVGLDKDRSELVIGIIDYIRTFTWDKKLENIMKTSVSNKQPTIIQPKDYRERFIAAMKRYFLPVPDRWYGFENQVL